MKDAKTATKKLNPENLIDAKTIRGENKLGKLKK
jgi:hypothetical protein